MIMVEKTQNTETYILFELAGTTYGVRSRDVLHMEMIDQITPVPNSRPFLEGVVFSRGQVIPALNLRARFGLPRQEHTLKSRLLVVQAAKRAVGLIVDSARQFQIIPDSAIQEADSALTGTTGKFLGGVANLGDHLVLLLDLETTLQILESETAGALETAVPA
jgi:chemotaxis signal transduction protein